MESTPDLMRFKFSLQRAQFNNGNTGWPKCIWTISWGCLVVTGWLKTKKINSSKQFMQIPLKVNISLKSSMTLKEEEEGAVVELQHLLELQLEEADINNNLDCTYGGRDGCGSNFNIQYCTVYLYYALKIRVHQTSSWKWK